MDSYTTSNYKCLLTQLHCLTKRKIMQLEGNNNPWSSSTFPLHDYLRQFHGRLDLHTCIAKTCVVEGLLILV